MSKLEEHHSVLQLWLFCAGNEHNIPEPSEDNINKEHNGGAVEPSHRRVGAVQKGGGFIQVNVASM